MSTHWDLKCTSCGDADASLGFSVNHGDEECCRLWFAREALADLAAAVTTALKSLDSHGGNRFEVELRHWSNGVDLQWFARHRGHQVVVVNEYGHVLGKCLERVHCKFCNAGPVRCGLPFAHDGEHVPADPDQKDGN